MTAKLGKGRKSRAVSQTSAWFPLFRVGPWLQECTGMTPAQLEAGLAAGAKARRLTFQNLVAIVQGFPPDLDYPDKPMGVLDKFADSVACLRDALETGALRVPCTPLEFLNWSRWKVVLPEAFTAALTRRFPAKHRVVRKASGQPAASRTSVASTTAGRTLIKKPVRHSGRPSTALRDDAVRNSAKEQAPILAAAGQLRNKTDLVEALAKEFRLGDTLVSRLVSDCNLDWSTLTAISGEASRRLKSK